MKLDWYHNDRCWIALKTIGLGPSENKNCEKSFFVR